MGGGIRGAWGRGTQRRARTHAPDTSKWRMCKPAAGFEVKNKTAPGFEVVVVVSFEWVP